jgi:hypothetical protein
MRLPNSLLHECQVFRNCHTPSLPQPSLAVQRIHHCRTTYLEVSGCVVGDPYRGQAGWIRRWLSTSSPIRPESPIAI